MSTPDFNDFAIPRSRLLVVDDEPLFIRLYHQLFGQQHEVFVATNGAQALELCQRELPDLVLLDVNMPPGPDGLSVCRQLKQIPETRAIPVVFVTAHEKLEDETACWEAGCVDFVNKPFNPLTLCRRVNVHLALKLLADQLRQLAYIDGLTGVANRRRFDERLALEMARARRNQKPLSLVLIDVDHFKRYNDHYGHLAGDECLRHVARVLRAGLGRAADLAARYGGEEFACLLPETDADGADKIAWELLRGVRELAMPHEASPDFRFVSISIGGIARTMTSDDTAETFVAEVDAYLYQAKSEGRNTVRGNWKLHPMSAR